MSWSCRPSQLSCTSISGECASAVVLVETVKDPASSGLATWWVQALIPLRETKMGICLGHVAYRSAYVAQRYTSMFRKRGSEDRRVECGRRRRVGLPVIDLPPISKRG